jgi:hypothetical protein
VFCDGSGARRFCWNQCSRIQNCCWHVSSYTVSIQTPLPHPTVSRTAWQLWLWKKCSFAVLPRTCDCQYVASSDVCWWQYGNRRPQVTLPTAQMSECVSWYRPCRERNCISELWLVVPVSLELQNLFSVIDSYLNWNILISLCVFITILIASCNDALLGWKFFVTSGSR